MLKFPFLFYERLKMKKTRAIRSKASANDNGLAYPKEKK